MEWNGMETWTCCHWRCKGVGRRQHRRLVRQTLRAALENNDDLQLMDQFRWICMKTKFTSSHRSPNFPKVPRSWISRIIHSGQETHVSAEEYEW